MNDVEELKRYALAHARAQRIARPAEVLARIRHDEGEGPGSWVAQWSRVARRLEFDKRDLEASRYYAMARFPYVDGPARQEAQDRCAAALVRWKQVRRPDLRRLDVGFPGGTVRCWATGLSAARPLPLLLLTGGIATIKEQWAPALAGVRRLGMAGIVLEMPGVGQNPLRYRPDSWLMLSGVLDAVADRARVDQTYAMALGFGGHLALRCAVDDPRIRGVVAIRAPVAEFFTNAAWQRTVPRITADTLAHMTGTEAGQAVASLADFALTARQLASLDIPVHYVSDRRDEVVPVEDAGLLERYVRRARLLTRDDIHGSRRQAARTRLWCVRSVLRMRGASGPRAAAAGLLWQAERTRRHLAGG